ncbi:MAG: hypothetical protein RL404_462 [Pseudomonadota bacterium]|jgi:MSHA pilin protein MshA
MRPYSFSPTIRRAHQQGFTLIELVIVIVIIGILAAIALPKMTDLAGNARAATIKGVTGSLASANTAIYSAAQIANQGGATGSISACNTTGIATVYGYAADTTELLKCVTLSPASDFNSATANTISHSGATTPASCNVVYTPATATAPPAYTVTVTGC